MKIKHIAGDKLYVPSAYYCSHGSDDVEGGLATIKDFQINQALPEGHANRVFVIFEEHPNRGLNYKYVLENQDEWSKEYGGKIARTCPDIDRPFIEKGDIVNGKEWKGNDIW